MNADRNLLFGILAFQNNFIDRQALLAAFDRWTGDKNRPLGDLLLEHGDLTGDEHALLDALVAKHVERHGGDPEKSLAAVSSLGSVRADLSQIADPELQASLAGAATLVPEPARQIAAALAAIVDPDGTCTASAGTRSSTGLRFTILRPHARGGLGQVSVALDEELNREVAFKEIQEQYADDAVSRARFVLEAEVTGGLEHPGIVPIYGLGRYRNVSEWCWDWFGNYSAEPVTDPIGPAASFGHVLRGGAYLLYAGYCGSAVRLGIHPVFRSPAHGFRVCCGP
jgi:hypothetical protein